ncbi:MAG: hypothetical protein MK198_14415 [Gracilimonas sp.]|uniref:hypothetical protein n=1 Tax=Gracilimonas sp. TaxID=1974203 RepID=UPI0037535F19|nr:hypothetical protein [Gracilimonas sp.]
MRILFISEYLNDEERIRNQLSGLCEGHSLTFCYSFESAKDFINNHIVKNQTPLDLIITYSKVNFKSSNSFRDWIRLDINRTYSKNDFNLSEIPIALIVTTEENKNAFHKYNLVVDDLGVERLNLFVTDLSSCIKSWRRAVLDELDSLGIQFNSGKIDYGYYFRNIKKHNIPTVILSENFKRFPRRLNYYWLDFNKKQIEKSIDKFIKMLKRSRRIGKKGEEKKYHEFFNENEFFLLRDAYSRLWYEPRLMKNSSEYEEPDYSLKPNFSYQTDLSVLEVKLPNEAFMTKKKYHKPPRSKLIQHIIQVNDYKDYLESDEYLSEINKVYGYVPKNINYNLLIGRKETKEEHLDHLEKTMRQLGQRNLNLMTYDDLMEYQVKFLSRMQLGSVI